MRSVLKLRYTLEGALIGLFFVQALRYLVGAMYGRISSAAIFPAIDQTLLDPAVPGLLAPEIVRGEIILLVYMIALPMLAVLLGRFRPVLVLAAGAVAVGRALMLLDTPVTTTSAAAIVLGVGLLYLALVIRYRARVLPYIFVLGFGVDQVYRAVGNTLDPSLSPAYSTVQLALSAIVVVLALLNTLRPDADERAQEKSLIPLWSGIGLGALLYLELALLASPNAIAGRANTDYTIFVPFVLAATLLPLVPQIQEWGRQFISLFDSSLRGWAWILLVALLIVFGTRFSGIFAGIALVIAQFAVSMMWWWLARPQAERERSFTGLWLVFSTLIFAVFVIFDLFTFEYAYVRDFARPLTFLNDIVPPLLRGFRGLGLGVLLLAVFLAAMPMVQARRRIPWKGAVASHSFAALVVVIAASTGAAYAARPIVVRAVQDVDTIRVAVYNIHAGYNEFFYYDLEAIANTIYLSGADVVLLQEVEAGRLTSFGVDQSLWLARRLGMMQQDPSQPSGMDRRFYATNEGLQGLAVLSRVPIVYDDGTPLTSIGSQTGLQRVQVRPDDGVITVYNVWLGLLAEGVGSIAEQEQDQQQQLSEVFNIIGSHHSGTALGRTVVGGTFNNIPSSDLVQRMIDAGFKDPFAGSPPLLSDTFWQTNRRARLDYLWLLNLSALGSNTLDSRASDHRLAVVGVSVR